MTLKAFCVLLWCVTAVIAEEWTVRTINLIPGKGRTDEGVKAKLEIKGNSLACSSRKLQRYDIPLPSIKNLSRDSQRRNLAAAYANSQGGGSGVELLILAALAPFQARWEYVTIQWQDNGGFRTTYLRFRSKDFPSFEREITARTHLTFDNPARQHDEIVQQIERCKPGALPVRLDRRTFIRNEPVRGGLYQMLIVERERGTGELYLFRGKQIDPKKPAWIVPVSITPSAENVYPPKPEYSPRRRWINLDSIHMPGRMVRIVP